MDTEAARGRAKLVMRTAAVLAGALAAYIICVVGAGLLTALYSERLATSLTLVFAMTPTIIYAGYCLFAAWKSWTRASAENARRISIVAAILFGSLFVVLPWLPAESWWPLTSIVAMAAGGIFYVLCSKLLLNWLGLPRAIDWERRERSIRTFFWVLAFLVFSAGSQFAMKLEPKDREHIFPTWPMATLLGSLVVAIVVYQACIRVALWHKPRTPGDKSAATPHISPRPAP